MLRLGVLGCLLLTAGLVVLAMGRSSAHATVEHSCGLTDRQFISNYQVQLESVGMYGDDYLSGAATAGDVISAADEAARIVRTSAPFDTSLQTVKHYAPAMFVEYGRAVRARSKGKDSTSHMYRAYNIGAAVQDTLREAEPALSAAGCDVSSLLTKTAN
jgi:hypothetical protein